MKSLFEIIAHVTPNIDLARFTNCDKAEGAHPTLYAEEIAIGNNGAVRQNVVTGGEVVDALKKPLPELKQGGHQRQIELPTSPHTPDEKVATVVTSHEPA